MMSVLKPRSRMISVRISEEEYAALRLLCSATGARSVSDLARDAMRVLVEATDREGEDVRSMQEFKIQMKCLADKIDQLTTEISTLRANGSSSMSSRNLFATEVALGLNGRDASD